MSAINGRGMKAKGDGYERELARYIADKTGLPDVARAPLSGGGVVGVLNGGADLIGTPHLHVEAKRTERMRLREALDQAERNVKLAHAPEIPVVVTRRNYEATGDSIVALRLSDFLGLYTYAVRFSGDLPSGSVGVRAASQNSLPPPPFGGGRLVCSERKTLMVKQAPYPEPANVWGLLCILRLCPHVPVRKGFQCVTCSRVTPWP